MISRDALSGTRVNSQSWLWLWIAVSSLLTTGSVGAVVSGGIADGSTGRSSGSLLRTRSRLKEGASSSPISDNDFKVAKETAIKGKALSETEGKDARLEASRLREMENLKQQELNVGLKASGNGVDTLDPLASIQDLSSATTKARVSAEKAATAAAQAVEFYENGRQNAWKLALSEAGKDVLAWKDHAERKHAEELEKRVAPTWQSRAVEKADEASKPYVEGMLRTQESMNLYNEKGFALANQASTLWTESQGESERINRLPRSTVAEANEAQAAMVDAREKAKEAQSMALEARQYLATAAEVRKAVPVYQYNAQKAAAEAVAGMSAAR